MIHEWGHLRWGLFEEYPVGDKDHFYISELNRVEPTRCNIHIQGRMRNRRSDSECVIDPKTSLPETDCRFYPSANQTTATGSIMSHHFLPTVSFYSYVCMFY